MLYWPELDDMTNPGRQNFEGGNTFDEGHFYHKQSWSSIGKKEEKIDIFWATRSVYQSMGRIYTGEDWVEGEKAIWEKKVEKTNVNGKGKEGEEEEGQEGGKRRRRSKKKKKNVGNRRKDWGS